MNFWFVFTVAPNKERSAAERLGSRGVLANVPLSKRAIRASDGHGGRKRTIEWRPTISGYVFVNMVDDRRLIARVLGMEFANGEPVVRSIVKFGGEYGKISEIVMAEFLQHVKDEALASSVKHSVKVGDTVRVKNGALAGQLAKVGSVEGTRVCLLTEMFKRSALTLVSIHNLELATQDKKTPTPIGKNLHCGANSSTRYPRDVGRSAPGEVSRQQEVPRAKWAR
jgi:transcription antitermination factor NusG